MTFSISEVLSFPCVDLKRKEMLPENSGIYFVVQENNILYIGKATNIKKRWMGHHRYSQLEKLNRKKPVKLYYYEAKEAFITELEKLLIEKHRPVYITL